MAAYIQTFDEASGQWVLVPVDPGIGLERQQDLLSRLPEAELAGAHGLGVVPVKSMRHGARAPDPDTPPPTWRPLAGVGPNNLGNTKVIDTFAAPTSAATFVTQILQTRSKGDDAEMVTVMLGFEVLADVVVGGSSLKGSFTVQGRLRWGIGTATYEAFVDWQRGTIVSLPCNYMNVDAVCPNNSSFPKANIPDWSLSASVAYGATPAHVNRAKLTESFTTGGAAVIIPPFAVGYSIIPTPGAPALPAPIVITQQDHSAAGNVLGVHQYVNNTNLSLQSADTYPISNGARVLLFTTAAPDPIGGFVVFELAF